MREVKGYICLAAVGAGREVPFGPKTKTDPLIKGDYNNFQRNNLTPFGSIEEAERIRAQLQKRSDIKGVSIAEIKMKIGETPEEMYSMRKEKSLIVIMLNDDKDSKDLLGPHVEGRYSTFYAIPGSHLEWNGYTTLDSFERAEHLGKEINRQGQCGVQLATFYMRRVSAGGRIS